MSAASGLGAVRYNSSLTALACAAVIGCGSAETPAVSSGDRASAGSIVFTAAQVEHGSVKWAAVEPATAATSAQVAGRLTANEDRTVRVSAPAQGRLVAVHVRIGDRVSAGQQRSGIGS